ncbi:ankyrin repeat domain-containing protein [Thiotrichales bacterium 19S3-7]|nr:ankyrin repeat domain-containing protein [Thiotrichales bacterium 19S3-7]MCF6801467.1 ankyrin repeat domain-containing protein [Thiotrichales bacterium 19S3-11]
MALTKEQQRELDKQLWEAARMGDLAKVKSLIEQGSDVNCVAKDNWTPLMMACFR